MNGANDSKQLRETVRILERRLGILKDSKFSCCGITMSQCHALVEIGRSGSISLNELAELIDLENSTLSRTVNNLVTSGLAKREIDPQDRRYVTISLTKSGQRLFKKIEGSMDSYYKKIFDQIPEGKRGQILKSLNILLEAIVKTNSCGGNNCKREWS